jgi:hypothetical protein
MAELVHPGDEYTTPYNYPDPAASASASLPVISLGDDRINILLLGIDRRGGTGWGYRTDTIIIVAVDTSHKTAGPKLTVTNALCSRHPPGLQLAVSQFLEFVLIGADNHVGNGIRQCILHIA